ncbi:dedicator of cytokinesis protein 1-like [Dendronephthya gigantea]|uniref:dedicator of cytokinesis protein 1-like n=1 Tax=Dendronephthya gigantea TaxID=151771 RepID=UPI00106AEC8C|nr:dedicator of cytokinesis protein 1-like [Dendronephthya gigantea]
MKAQDQPKRPSSWMPLAEPLFGVAIYNFDGTGRYMLPLLIGETVKIVEECGGWYRGCKVRNRNVQGIFPASFIKTKDWNMQSNKRDAALIQEMTSVLREWGLMWKHLYLEKNLDLFNLITKHMDDLMVWRRQISGGTLTVEQVSKLKQKVTAAIDYGNRVLDLDLVVRDKDGNILDPDVTGVIELYRRHDSTQTRISEEETKTSFPEVRFYSNPIHSLYINIKNVVCNIGDDADVFVTLYEPPGLNGKEGRFISEHYLVSWDKHGLPKDLNKLHNMCCLFTDLGSKDLEREKIYVVCQIVRVGRLELKDVVSRKTKLTQDLRRPFGVAVLDVTDFIHRKIEMEEDKERFLPLLTIDNTEYLHQWITKAISRSNADNPSKGQGIWISARLLRGDKDQAALANPAIINNRTSIARKLGFPEVIMPGDVRNDMFITIVAGKFDKGDKTANKNVEMTMRVCDQSGKVVPNVISLGAGEPLLTEYRSCVYRHSLTPEWHETVKLVIPIDYFYSSHLTFTFKHRSSNFDKDKGQKITNFAYVRLMNVKDGTTLLDGDHDLVVYKCDTKEIKDNSYFKLPSLKSELHLPAGTLSKSNALCVGQLTLSHKESFQITSLLCSTKLTQNVDLLGLLKWKSQMNNLRVILPQVTNVKGEEIVKFLQDIFDALFAILMESPDKYGKLVFDDLVFVINLLADKKYSHFRPVLDTYIADLFSAAKAYDTLICVITQYVMVITECRSPKLDLVKFDYIFKTMKAIEYIFKLIIRSRLLYERTSSDPNPEKFRDDLNRLFRVLVAMMMDTKNETLKIQGQALKNIPSIFGHALKIYDPVLLGEFARDLITNIPQGRLNSQKLTCIHDMVKSELFQNEVSRHILLPMLTRELSLNLIQKSEMKVCADIISDLLVTLNQQNVGQTFDDVHTISLTLLHPILNAVIRIERTEQYAGKYFACFISLLSLMSIEHYDLYVVSFEDRERFTDFLITLFMHFRDIIAHSFYQKDWVTMIMVQNNVIVRALNYFSGALETNFLDFDGFNIQLWTSFFELSVSFITQGPLNLENFTETKRSKILSKYGDMRKSVALKIRDMWQKLGSHKTKFIPGLVGPFLEMTLIPEEEIRKDTIPIFFDMIICENNAKGGFREIENEIIRKLDIILESGRGDEEYKALFGQILSSLFSVNPKLCHDGKRFVETITTLLEKLLDYRTVLNSDDSIDNRMSCIVNLLNFYKEIKRDEMYIRYLYKLYELHVSVLNYTEAAFTLLLHADILKWSDDAISIDDHGKFQAETQRCMKEKLFKEIIELFNKGQTWEEAIKYCKELAEQYEKETFQYVELGQILRKEAGFFDNIVTKLRAESSYFRVGFYGQGFPTFLRNKEFIYRGKDYEQIGDFTVRIQNNFPTAQVMTKLTPPGEDIKNSNEQHLQINLVDPVPIERRKYQGKVISEQITQFYERNEVNQFKYDRPFHKGKKDKDNEFATLWLERTCLQTKYRFPGILCWFEVTHISRYEITPLNLALETMEQKNQELKTLISRYKKNPQQNINPLSMSLNGVIDAAVMGGIANYTKAFLSQEFLMQNPNDAHSVDRLKQLIIDQYDILKSGMAVHKELVTDALRPFHDQLEKRFVELMALIPPRKKKTPPFHRQYNSVKERQKRISTPVRSGSTVGGHNRSTVIIDNDLGPTPEEAPPLLPEKHMSMSPEKGPPLPRRSVANVLVQGSPTLSRSPRSDDEQPPPKPERERKSTMARPTDINIENGPAQHAMQRAVTPEGEAPPRPPKTPKKT